MVKPLLLVAALGLTAPLLSHASERNTASTTRFHLAAVVDTRKPDSSGLPVLTVTPGGAADRMGLRSGDRLLAVNGVRLDDGDTPSATLERAVAAGHGDLRVELTRNGQTMSLSGAASAINLTTNTLAGCGYVTDQAEPTPDKEQIFRAVITAIDGKSTPLNGRNRHQLASGNHVLTIAEAIPTYRFGGGQLNQINKLKKFSTPSKYPFKALIVDVAPGNSYRIGARLLKDKLDTESIRDNAYWEPVIWKVVPERCG